MILVIRVVKICCGLTWLRRVSPNILSSVMVHIIVDKSTDHAKPHSICQTYQYVSSLRPAFIPPSPPPKKDYVQMISSSEIMKV